MKIYNKIYAAVFVLLCLTTSLCGCQEADPEFVHINNLISQLVARGERAGTDFIGSIYEYDANGQLLPPDFKAADAEGGSGVIVFVIPASEKETIDLTKCYLRATLTYDEFIYPTMSGRHNILVTEENPNGKVFAVKSGVNTVRKYRVMGIYE